MASIDAFRPEDARAIVAMYRRVFGNDSADENRLRWEWQYAHNPNNPAGGPLIWVAREGSTVVGQYATMPVRLQVAGAEIDASWGMDVMIAPERQRQGLGDALFRWWDQHGGASLGLGLSEASYRLFQKLHWPNAGPVPCLIKPLSRRAFRRPNWPMPINRLVSALTHPLIRIISRSRPLRAEIVPVDRFGEEFTLLWKRLAPKFDFSVKRDAAYLNWKYLEPPHVRYSTVALRRGSEVHGYAVYRHVREPRGRVTLLVDFLAHPDDDLGVKTILRWVDQEARRADSDKIRAFALHEGFRRIMKRSGYFQVKSTMEFMAKINAIEVPPGFYASTARWHVTLGDSDQDR
ncbi:MAG: GNAT family N-acetyltransferase [Acidobacteria bacterium]|nr:GNAT family N-acetyltransferase [Acidobacteriota bacterium]